MKIQLIIGIVSFVLTILAVYIILPILKKLKIGQIERREGVQSHLSKAGTLTMGGVCMLIPIAIVLFIASFWYKILVLPLILILGFGFVGFIDDRKKLIFKSTDGISAMQKMLLLFIVSAIYIVAYFVIFNLSTELIIPFFEDSLVAPLGIYILLMMFILLGGSNAINLTDGLDGLAAGICSIVMAFFTLVAIKLNDTACVILGSCVLGSTLGFLIFNIKPAKMFMGDTGSLALGGAVVAISSMLSRPIYLAIVLLIPVLETLSVLLQVIYFKITHGKRLFKMAPLHHHLELSGMKEENVVILFWIVTFILCCVAYFI